MKRSALIIYMSNSPSGKLDGPVYDYQNIREYLMSPTGGKWLDEEIIPCQNPYVSDIRKAIEVMNKLDYSFIVLQVMVNLISIIISRILR